jgi:hypothetical protein
MQPAPQDNQLMSKHRVLSFKPQLRLEWRGQHGQSETEQPDHSASLGDSITASTRIRFSVHTGLLNVEGYFDMLLAFLDSAVTARFVKDVHRSSLIVEKHSEQLLDRFESYVLKRPYSASFSPCACSRGLRSQPFSGD